MPLPSGRSIPTLTPFEYELAVKAILDADGLSLQRYASGHLQPVSGVDGEYIIDVVATFDALGAAFVVLVECKHEKRKVERQDVQVLKSKLESTGAHKGMLFSISGFQRGAVEYADVHGIALVQLVDGFSTWHTRSIGLDSPPPTWQKLPRYVGWWHHGSHRAVLSAYDSKYTQRALDLPGNNSPIDRRNV